MAEQAPAGWRRLLDRLRGATAETEPDADETAQPETGEQGQRIVERELATLTGTVDAVTVRPRATRLSDLVVEIGVDDHAVRLVWLGRHGIAGIEPGRSLTARGRVCLEHGVPTIFNPAYELHVERN